MKPVSLYIHVPFCLRKCAYCDFNSVVYRGDLAGRYIAALEREMELRRADFAPETVYIGGGTPTCLDAAELRRLLDAIRARFDLSMVREFTVEANPATIDEEKADVLLAAGVNRFSIGAQSFQNPLLKTLGRIHSAEETLKTCALLRKRGVANISLDLIFAVPGETLAMWEEDLRRACDLEPEHVSAYCLTYEPDTPLGRAARDGRAIPLSEDIEAEMYLLAVDALPARGCEQYEISNFARPGRKCAHNVAYWLNRNSLGLGPGAFSYIEGKRSSNARGVGEYIALVEEGLAIVFEETLDREAAAREAAILALRMRAGIDRKDFLARTGVEIDSLFDNEMRAIIDQGFFEDDGATLRVSRKGLPVTDSLLLHLMR